MIRRDATWLFTEKGWEILLPETVKRLVRPDSAGLDEKWSHLVEKSFTCIAVYDWSSALEPA